MPSSLVLKACLIALAQNRAARKKSPLQQQKKCGYGTHPSHILSTFTLPSMYAIVDIETTGGHATANGITEIAIVLHNGRETEGRFHTLINPQLPIPRHISALTGITNEMVYDAPRFADVADKIYNLLQQRIFIAHK